MLIVLRNAFQSMVCFPTKRTSSVLSRFSLWYQLPQLYPGRHPAERAERFPVWHTAHEEWPCTFPN